VLSLLSSLSSLGNVIGVTLLVRLARGVALPF
jgi:hypothetical protein